VTRNLRTPTPVTGGAQRLYAWQGTQRRNLYIYTRLAGRQLQRAARAPLSWRHKHWLAAGLACAAVIVIGSSVPSGASATHQPDTAITTLELPLPLLDGPLADGYRRQRSNRR